MYRHFESPSKAVVEWSFHYKFWRPGGTCKNRFPQSQITIFAIEFRSLGIEITDVRRDRPSAKVNAICRPKALEEGVTFFFDLDECTETAINTGYTDFYASMPVQKPVTKK
jgi:hypothetical protein